jgi:SNF2 family DNA or RNA helicase
MGTGKTRAALYAFDYLRKLGRAKKLLVSAKLSTLTPVWENELFRLFPHLKFKVLYGTMEKRHKLLAEEADVYIINHHGVKAMADALVARRFDVLVLDESSSKGLRNKSSDLWKGHATVVEKIPFAWAMTGSPMPHSPVDAWAQLRLITPDRTTRTKLQFEDQTMKRITQFKLVAREDANDTVFKAMQPSVRFTRDDIQELPETIYKNVDIDLDPQAKAAYKMLFDKMRTFTNTGESITAANEGILQTKLLQVACGYIYTDKKTVYALPNQARLDALDNLVDENDRKIIVFVPFVHALEGVAAHLRKGGWNVGLVHGGVSRGRRDLIFKGFQYGVDPHIIVAHPECMAHGLTLTSANLIIWYGPTQSLETYEQANARIVRPSQTSKTMIAHLIGTTVERVTYSRLRARAKMQGVLLEMFHQQALEY